MKYSTRKKLGLTLLFLAIAVIGATNVIDPVPEPYYTTFLFSVRTVLFPCAGALVALRKAADIDLQNEELPNRFVVLYHTFLFCSGDQVPCGRLSCNADALRVVQLLHTACNDMYAVFDGVYQL